jgi:hypothetical protein
MVLLLAVDTLIKFRFLYAEEVSGVECLAIVDYHYHSAVSYKTAILLYSGRTFSLKS